MVFHGLPVAGGLVIGKALVIDADDVHVPRRQVAGTAVPAEVARLEKAITGAVNELQSFQAQAEKEMGKETAKIFQVHQAMLKDSGLIVPMKKLIEKELVSAEYAAHKVLSDVADRFRAMGDSAFGTKVNDIDDLDHRLHRHLMGTQRGRLKSAPPGTIVVAKDLTPSQAVSLDRKRILGFVTDLGGSTSHTAIIAKALEIPAVVGLSAHGALIEHASDGQDIVLDGEEGVVVLNPTPQTLESFRRTIEKRRLFRVSLTELADLPAVTEDGTRVSLVGNIELPDEVERVLNMGGEGVGLYRTEYLYLTSDHEPTEEEHFKAYRRCVQLCDGRELVIRTFDLGADKAGRKGEEEAPERNPFLGNRSIRYCLKSPGMFKRQLRAILRASALGPVKVMFPLISSIAELRQARFMLHDVMEDLEDEGVKFDRSMPVGMMVEVPSAALLADLFAREVDFFSIGTNDLVQYTLAVDRVNERVAYLYQPTHPAVIKLLRDTSRAARRRGIPVSCCGEAAGELEYAMLLVGLGLRTLSVSSSAIPALKRFIRSVSIQECERVARQALSLDSDATIAALLRDRARRFVPEAFSGRSAE
jgi:phosphotransferase system enzyme I (PtsI)